MAAEETIQGIVQNVNAKGTGVRIANVWHNISQYASGLTLPEKGQSVVLHLVRDNQDRAWVQAIDILAAAPPVERTSHAPASTDWDDRQESIRRQAVMNTTVAIWTIAERIAESESPPDGIKVGRVAEIVDVMHGAMLHTFMQLEHFAKKGNISMVEAAIELGATIEPTLSDDMATQNAVPWTPEQRARINALALEKHVVASQFIVGIGLKVPLTQYAAGQVILALQQLV